MLTILRRENTFEKDYFLEESLNIRKQKTNDPNLRQLIGSELSENTSKNKILGILGILEIGMKNYCHKKDVTK